MAARTRTTTLDTLYTTTWQLRWKGVRDQVMEAIPFFYLMNKKGRKRYATGGTFIEVDLRYAKNTTVRFIGKGDTVTLQHVETLTTAKYDWKYLTGHIYRYMTDDHQNKGKSARIRKVKSDIDTLADSLQQDLEVYLFGDATDDDGRACNGLGNLVPSAPATGTVGGINRANYAWWRNQYYDATGKALSVYIIPRMLNMFNTCGKYADGAQRFPDVIVTTQALHEQYELEAGEIGRIAMGDKKLADLGFGDSAYKGRPIVWSPQCPDYAMFFLNTAYLEWVVDPAEEFALGKWLDIYTTVGDMVAHNLTACNLVGSNYRKQGKILNFGN